MHFTGDASFLGHPAILSAKQYAGQADVILRDGPTLATAAQGILAEALAHGTQITRFEVSEPTLEEIFIETVGEHVEA